VRQIRLLLRARHTKKMRKGGQQKRIKRALPERVTTDGSPFPFVIVDGKLLTFSSSLVLLLLWFTITCLRQIITEACQSVEPATLIPVTQQTAVGRLSCWEILVSCHLLCVDDHAALCIVLEGWLHVARPSVSSPVDNTLKDTSYLDLPVKQAMSLVRSENAASVSSLRTESDLLVLCSCPFSTECTHRYLPFRLPYFTTAYSRLRPSWRGSDLFLVF
jgi:hypothetical protein